MNLLNKTIRVFPTALIKSPDKKRNEKFAVETEMRDSQSISIEQKGKCTETYLHTNDLMYID